MDLKSIAVFCGSRSGKNPLFALHAQQLGNLLAANNVCLIYGGGNKGLMGSVANGVLDKGGRVVGIIPEILTGWEQQHDDLTELIVVENMHVRKRLLYEKADAALVMPGGFGSMDELFEMLTWNQLSIHDKPVYVLNTGGFYNALLQQMELMEQEGLLYHPLSELITVIHSPEELFSNI